MIKYTKAIITGEMIIPSISPNFIQNLFNGVSNGELIVPRIKKIREVIVK